MKSIRVFFILALTAVSMAACAGNPGKLPENAMACRQPGGDAPSYRIGAGDVLRIGVWNDKNLQRTVTVRPDGKISFPLLNDIPAAGKTPMQLSREMTRGLKTYIADPQVSVVVQAVHSFTVSVLGQVQHPGRYEMPSGKATVLDSLAMAGGLTPYANGSEIHVIRENETGTERIPFNYGRAVSMKGNGVDFCVSPGDIVIVP